MKTNLVKKGSEKNIEMFQMSNKELETISGGKYEIGYDENGDPIFIWRPGITFSSFRSIFYRF